MLARPLGRVERLQRFYGDYRFGVNLVLIVVALLTAMLIYAIGAKRESDRHRLKSDLDRKRVEQLYEELVAQTRIAKTAQQRQRAEEARSRARDQLNQAIELYRAGGDRERVEQLIAQVRPLIPDAQRLLRLQGEIALDRSQLKRAKKLLKRALAADPQDAETCFLMFRWYYQTGWKTHPEADRLCRTAARLGPNTAFGLWAKARLTIVEAMSYPEVAKRIAARERVLSDLHRALQLRPGFAWALYL